MNSFQKDKNNQHILLSSNNEQVMMEWEKPYMEASIDMLKPTGRVLEIGFGCGYSATQIMKYKPKSYTIVECDPVVIQKIKEWRTTYPNTPIHIVEGRWQDKIHKLGIFDEIYFDDFPLNISKESSQIEIAISNKRMNIFIDLCIQNHTKIGSRICFYLNGNQEIILSSDTEPFINSTFETIEMNIPSICKYRNIEDQKCTIPLIKKVKKYNFRDAQLYALNQIQQSITKQ